MKPLLTASSFTTTTIEILPHLANPGSNFSNLPKTTNEKGQLEIKKSKKLDKFNRVHAFNSSCLQEESISYSLLASHHEPLLPTNEQATVDLSKKGTVNITSTPKRSTNTILASVTPSINHNNKQKSSTRLIDPETLNNKNIFTRDSQLTVSNNNNNTMPSTTVVTNNNATSTTLNRRKNGFMPDSPSCSTSSLASSSSSSSFTSPQVEIFVDSPSTSSPQQPQQQEKNSIRKAIKEYYKIEGLLEKNDEGLQLLRAYLSERRNDEMLIYLESNREFKLLRQNYSNNVNMSRKTLMREFKTVYENFVNFESLTCMNIASSIREPFTQTLKEVQLLSQDEIPNQTLCEKMEKCLDSLLFNIQLQFNNEIMRHFKKSSEFKTFVITKLIELSASETSSIMEDMEKTSPRTPGEFLISNILIDNEMEEYSKTFTKKKLVTLDQIRYFTADDYRDKIGMKKIGHLKRIVRVVNEHFNKQSSNIC